MAKENKFGNWGAWVAAAGIAIGGGHELMKDTDKDKAKVQIEKDKDSIEDNKNDEDTTDLPNLPKEKNDTANPINTQKYIQKITDQVKEINEEEQIKAKFFLDQINKQLHDKMTTYERQQLEKKLAGGSLDPDEQEIYQDEEIEKRQKTEEYAKTHPDFDKIKKILEAKLPNITISTERDSEGEFHIYQDVIYYTNDNDPDSIKKTRFYVSFNINDGTYTSSNRHDSNFTEWSAQDEESFLTLLTKQIQAGLLGEYYGMNHNTSEPLITILKSHNILEQYQDILREAPPEE